MDSADLSRLLSGAEEVIPENGLEEKLALGRPLRVKLGIDPSRPDLHLGHAVVLRKLRQFQDLGHTAVLIIGDFTARIGDPSGQSQTRTFISPEQIEPYARTYLDQAGLVLDIKTVEVRRNSEWLAEMPMAELLRLSAAATIARMLERDDFATRYEEKKPISVVEFLYPLLQAMDSVQVQADIEMGGTDQRFNLLVGRDIQKVYGQEPQVVFTMPLLEGTDGQRKMSKSYDNYVSLTDAPDDIFGKLMRIPDELIAKYLRLCTDVDAADVVGEKPVEQKRRLAREVVELYHGAGAGVQAGGRFDVMHKEREIPDDVAAATIPPDVVKDGKVWLPKLLSSLGLASSNSEAKRLIEQGGVRMDGVQLSDPDAEIPAGELAGHVLQVGRRKFVKLG